MKRQFSAGGVVYKKEKGQTFWLLIQPKGTDYWQFPKGLIKEGESAQDTAVREIREEGGVTGQIVEKIGSSSWWFIQDGERVFKTTTYFLMGAEKDTGKIDPVEVERAVWLLADEAEKELSFASSKKIFAQAQTILASRLF
jgi:8-oxo-dGTP diphosphatase